MMTYQLLSWESRCGLPGRFQHRVTILTFVNLELFKNYKVKKKSLSESHLPTPVHVGGACDPTSHRQRLKTLTPLPTPSGGAGKVAAATPLE